MLFLLSSSGGGSAPAEASLFSGGLGDHQRLIVQGYLSGPAPPPGPPDPANASLFSGGLGLNQRLIVQGYMAAPPGGPLSPAEASLFSGGLGDHQRLIVQGYLSAPPPAPLEPTAAVIVTGGLGLNQRLIVQGYMAAGVGPATLLESIAAFWLASPALRAATSDGRLWLDEAPESIDLPYAVIELVQDLPETWTTANIFNRALVSISLYAATAAAAASAMRSVIVPAFTLAPLTVGGEPVMHILPESSGVEISPEFGPRGQDVWAASQRFEVLYLRTSFNGD